MQDAFCPKKFYTCGEKVEEAFAGRLHIGNLDAKAYIQVGIGEITFE